MAEHARPSPFAPIKINLVEQEGWEPYNTANGKAMDWIHDSGWEDFRHMPLSTLEDLVDDIASVPQNGKKKSKLKLDSDQIEYLAEQLKERNDQLEITQRMIVDTATWMYEAAAIPNNSDVEEAMEKAKEDFEEDSLYGDPWDPILDESVRRGPKDWSPVKRYSSEEVKKQLLARISFEREKNHWDRYLVFDFWEAPVIQTLFSRWKGSPWAYDRLKSEFKMMADGYVSDVLKHLDKIMQGVDINNRTDWNDSWKSMLTSGEAWGAQDEMVEVLKDMPKEAEDA